MVFVPNATTGVNTVLRSLKLDSGDKILVTDTTYQACRNAVDAVVQRSGCEVSVAHIPLPLDDEEEIVEAVLGAVDGRTRLALIDTISSPTGIRMPFERLVRDLQNLGIDVLLDAAHGRVGAPRYRCLRCSICDGELSQMAVHPQKALHSCMFEKTSDV